MINSFFVMLIIKYKSLLTLYKKCDSVKTGLYWFALVLEFEFQLVGYFFLHCFTFLSYVRLNSRDFCVLLMTFWALQNLLTVCSFFIQSDTIISD